MISPISEKCRIDSLSPFYNFPISVDVLRLDLLHPIVSGNKWFKLKGYIQNAKDNNKKTLLTFGGAYSNHIVASAAAANLNGFKSIGIIRGDQPLIPSPSLQDALHFGMKLYYNSREDYKQKKIPDAVFKEFDKDDHSIVPEGGYGKLGAIGAAAILHSNETTSYTHILSATGTGTTLAGIAMTLKPGQKVIGISVLKNAFSLQHEIENLLPLKKVQAFTLLHDYHFGGYAKYTQNLFQFMNEIYMRTRIQTDFVYTAKAFYAAFDLLKKNYFNPTDRLLILHTGGLQGNRSLKNGTLIFN
jgi:1-aminocyclopropane-1-carboxylate deaminase